MKTQWPHELAYLILSAFLNIGGGLKRAGRIGWGRLERR